MRFKLPIKIPTRAGAFAKNYRLPLWSTAGLVVILVVLIALRTYERGIIAGVLGDKSSSGSDYARLLSKDKDEELKKNNTSLEGGQTAPSSTTSNSSTSLTINSSGGSTTTGGTGGTTPPPGDGGGNEEPTDEPFSAQITGFWKRSETGPFICGGSDTHGPTQLCKQYDFAAGVNTYNGPGTVGHKINWRGIETGQMTGSFQAAAGDAFTQVVYVVKLRCDKPGLYFFKFALTQPNVTESPEIPINHNCTSTSP